MEEEYKEEQERKKGQEYKEEQTEEATPHRAKDVVSRASTSSKAPVLVGPICISQETILGEGEEIPKEEPIAVCSCLLGSPPKIQLPPRKEYILTIASRTEEYLKMRRIPELTRFLLTKLLISRSDKPVEFLEKLLNDCMLFRAGLGVAPVLYERRHLEAVVKSFDPLNRGWLSAGQVRRAFVTLGLPLMRTLDDQIPTALVLDELEEVQEKELYKLVTAGTHLGYKANSEIGSWASAN